MNKSRFPYHSHGGRRVWPLVALALRLFVVTGTLGLLQSPSLAASMEELGIVLGPRFPERVVGVVTGGETPTSEGAPLVLPGWFMGALAGDRAVAYPESVGQDGERVYQGEDWLSIGNAAADEGDAPVPGGIYELDKVVDNDGDTLADAEAPDVERPKTQLGMILDGSGSISFDQWTIMRNGLAAAVENADCVPQDGSVELTVVQFSQDARVEIYPTVLTAANVGAVADDIQSIAPLVDTTCIACGVALTADTLAASPHFSPTIKQALNLVTDGVPNRCYEIEDGDYVGDDCPGCDFAGCTAADNSSVFARDYLIGALQMTQEQDGLDAEGVGITTSNRDWLRDEVVWPEPGSEWNPPGPVPDLGWVRVVEDYQAFADTVCGKFQAVLKPGAITVVKEAVPADEEQVFDFTSTFTETFRLGASNVYSITVGGLISDTYEITETVPSDWDLTAIVCEDESGDSRTDLGSGVATVALGPSEHVTCTFTNTRRQGHIVVQKQTLPDGDMTAFAFTGDLFAALADGGTRSKQVDPGTYTVTETAPEGWDLSAIVCDDDDSIGDIDARTATFEVDPGETVTCVFTNTKRGMIVVEKQTEPDGDTTTFDFTGDLTDSLGDGETASVQVTPGTYTVTEMVVSGWDLSAIVCDDDDSIGDIGARTATFEVDAGETVTCVFTNTKRGTVVVEKQTEPDGDTTTFDFTGDLTDSLGDGETASLRVMPGTYTVTEMVESGWDLSAIECDDDDSIGDIGARTATFEVDPGETVTCVFTNTGRMGTIELQKVWEGTAGEATLRIGTTEGGDEVVSTTVTGDGSTGVQTVETGTYYVSESELPGYDSELTCYDGSGGEVVPGAGNSVAVGGGEVVTCVYTNTQRSTMVVEKVALGGVDTFTFSGSGAGIDPSFDIDTSVSATERFTDVVPGVKTITEDMPPSGWSFTDLVCVDPDGGSSVSGPTATVDLDVGETVTCTFTNTKRGRIVVEKQTEPDGDTTTFDFTGDLTDSLGDGETASVQVMPGTYTVTETVESGWDLSAIVCDDDDSIGDLDARTATFGVDPGETVTCVFTNTKRGRIVVEKQTEPDGDTTTFDFTGDLTDSLGDGETASVRVMPGTYTVTETAPEGWDLSAIECDDDDSIGDLDARTAAFEVDPGETVTCVFTNTARPEVAVDKRLAALDRGAYYTRGITFTIVVSNVGPNPIDIVPLEDVYDAEYFSFAGATPYPEEDADDGVLRWHDLTQVPPHGFGVDLAPGEAFSVTVVFTVAQEFVTTVNTAVVSGAVDIYGTVVPEVEDELIVRDTPTAAELLYFRIDEVSGREVAVGWATAVELDTLGFNLYRSSRPDHARADLVAALPARGHGIGRAYRYVDDVPADGLWWYWLGKMGSGGGETVYGPVSSVVGAAGWLERFYLPMVLRD